MSHAGSSPGRARQQRIALAVLLLILVGVAGWLAWIHGTAWVYFERGRAALDADPAAARTALDRCLETWPSGAQTHFLAAQAARQCGDLPAAERHLEAAARFGWDQGAID